MQLAETLKLVGDHFLDCLTIVPIDDPERRCVYVNEKFEQHTGYTASEAIGRNLNFLQGQDTSPAAIAFMRENLDARNACCIDVMNYRKSGEAFVNRLVMLPIERDGDGVFVGFQNVIHAAGERAHQDISHGEINHVLNSPLTALIMQTELAIETGENIEEGIGGCREVFARINRYCRHIDRPEQFETFNPFRSNSQK